MSDRIREEFWGHQFDDLFKEIVREATICKVRLLDPGVVEAVLQDNPSVCGHDNPVAFKKLRELLMMGFVMRGKAFERLGPLEADALIQSIREKLQGRFGGALRGSMGGTEA